jgi:hypothetical protein
MTGHAFARLDIVERVMYVKRSWDRILELQSEVNNQRASSDMNMTSGSRDCDVMRKLTRKEKDASEEKASNIYLSMSEEAGRICHECAW